MKRVMMDIETMRVLVTYEFVDGRLWVHSRGQIWAVEGRGEKKRAGLSSHRPASGDLRAPMPGKILKIMIQPGDRVKVNQVLLAMEAMKMEYTLKSQVNGVVEKILCREGQQVALDELLAQISGGAL